MLSKETLLYMKFALKKFFSTTKSINKLSGLLAEKVQLFEVDLELGNVDEPRYEKLLYDLVCELDEHMYMWNRALNGRANDFIHQGSQFLLLLTAPTIKTCINDILSLKHLLLPPSYHVEVQEKGDNIYYKITHSDGNTPIPHIKEDSLIAQSLIIFREICGSEFDYTQLWFPQNRAFFNADIVAQATKATIKFHDGAMTAVFKKNDYEAVNYLYDGTIRSALLKSIELKYNPPSKKLTFTDEVVNILSNGENPASLNADHVAAKLSMSISTFRRNLVDENTSFKELQGKVVDQISFDYLLLDNVKIDAISHQLGYTERSSFERAFRNKFGTTPANLRSYMSRLDEREGGADIQKLIDTLPPLPESCRLLTLASESENFSLEIAVNIIEKDPVFSGRIMGLANKAIYGRPPRDLNDAIGRNVGLAALKNLSVVFAASNSLENEIIEVDVVKFIQSQIITPDIFRAYSKNLSVKKSQQASFDQILMFGLLGLLILLHKEFNKNQSVIDVIKTSSGLVELMARLRKELNISLLGTTAILLSMWGVNAQIIKQINHLETKLAKSKPLSQADSVILISFSSSLSLCLGLDFKEAIQAHAKRVNKVDFEGAWRQAEEIVRRS